MTSSPVSPFLVVSLGFVSFSSLFSLPLAFVHALPLSTTTTTTLLFCLPSPPCSIPPSPLSYTLPPLHPYIYLGDPPSSDRCRVQSRAPLGKAWYFSSLSVCIFINCHPNLTKYSILILAQWPACLSNGLCPKSNPERALTMILLGPRLPRESHRLRPVAAF